MNGSLLLDTDILVDLGRGIDQSVHFIVDQEKQNALQISVITYMELLVGCRNKTEIKALDQILTRFQIIGLNEQISDIAVNLFKSYCLSHGILIPDALIAATALYLDSPLVTKNMRDYRFIPNLKLNSIGS